MRTEGGEEDEAAGGEDGAVLVPYYPYPPPYDRVSEDDLWDDLNFEHAYIQPSRKRITERTHVECQSTRAHASLRRVPVTSNGRRGSGECGAVRGHALDRLQHEAVLWGHPRVCLQHVGFDLGERAELRDEEGDPGDEGGGVHCCDYAEEDARAALRAAGAAERRS